MGTSEMTQADDHAYAPREQVNEFTREMKACLLGAAEEAGNRMVAISNARLPKKPNKYFTRGN